MKLPAKTECVPWPINYDDVFWDYYPRRVGKKDAMKALAAVRKAKEVPFEVLISAVKNFARSVVGKEMKFVPYPATWLRAGRWYDDPEALLAGPVKAAPGQVVGVLIRRDTAQAKAWETWRGKPFPWGVSSVWTVPSEYPPREVSE